MNEFFLTIVNMSISASWIVLVVLFLRLLLKKAPKWITVLIWGIVALRLVCPATLESVMSLIPSAETISPEIMLDTTPEIDSGIPILNDIINPIIDKSFAPDYFASSNPLQIWIAILSQIWFVGIIGMLIYAVISCIRIRNKVVTAVPLRDNVFQSENVLSPFVFGVIKPKIYLPFNVNEQDMEHVIAHEQAHIVRKDHWWKPIGFLILTLHWFNPFVWIGYILLCRDIELACDERVVKEYEPEQKANYSQALLNCSVNRHVVSACPIAFGEVGMKARVKSVLNYKKPAFWVVLIAIVLSVVVAICFLTNPRTSVKGDLAVFLDMQISAHHYSEGHTGDNFITVSQKVLDVDRNINETIVYMWVLYHEYSYENGEIKLKSGAHVPTVITAKRTGAHGHYELLEYWEPRDGSYYAKDIKSKFPWYLHSKALDSQRYIKEQIAFCENAAKEYYSTKSSYEVTPFEEIQSKYDNEEFVYQKAHHMDSNCTWLCEGYSYKYRLEITGKMNTAAKNTTYIVLSNSTDITFEQTWKASGLSSNMSDYFDPKDAVIVGYKLFTGSVVENDLDAAIISTLKEKYASKKPDGLLHVENYALFAKEDAVGNLISDNHENHSRLTVYLLVYHMKYSMGDGHIEEYEGDFVPTSITFSVGKDGNYVVEEYWVPSTDNYEKDVKEKFPVKIADEALNVDKYAEELIKESWQIASRSSAVN